MMAACVLRGKRVMRDTWRIFASYLRAETRLQSEGGRVKEKDGKRTSEGEREHQDEVAGSGDTLKTKIALETLPAFDTARARVRTFLNKRACEKRRREEHTHPSIAR